MHKTNFKANDLKLYKISIDEVGERIEVYFEDDDLGHITLKYRYDPPIVSEHYYANELALNNCKGKGLGEAAFIYHKELFGLPIVAAKERGPKLSDGSHLIDDGIPFMRRMREKGVVCS